MSFPFFAATLIVMFKISATTLLCLFCLAIFSIANADTPLELSMKKFEKAYKQLTLDLKQPQEAEKNDYLTLADTLKTETQKARDFVPKKAADLPADQQAAMVKDYQKSMDDFGVTVDALIAAIQASNWDEARTAMTKLHQEEHDGHQAFRKKEKQ